MASHQMSRTRSAVWHYIFVFANFIFLTAAELDVRQTQITPGTDCADSENLWNCMTTTWQQCASGLWSEILPSPGDTICSPVGQSYDMQLENFQSVSVNTASTTASATSTATSASAATTASGSVATTASGNAATTSGNLPASASKTGSTSNSATSSATAAPTTAESASTGNTDLAVRSLVSMLSLVLGSAVLDWII